MESGFDLSQLQPAKAKLVATAEVYGESLLSYSSYDDIPITIVA